MDRVACAIAIACFTVHPVSAQSRIQPFVAEQTLTDYRGGAHGTRTLARRSDGALATVQSIVLGKTAFYATDGPAYSRELVMPNGESFRLVDVLRAKSTWPRIPEEEAARTLRAITDPAPDCGIAGSNIRVIGRDLVEGLEALVTQDAANNGIRTMQWVVPKLGCAVLKSTIQQAPPNGPPALIFETSLARLTLAEPDEKLFYVGTDYSEMRPSRVLELQQKALKIDAQDRGGAALDRKYGDR